MLSTNFLTKLLKSSFFTRIFQTLYFGAQNCVKQGINLPSQNHKKCHH